MARILFITTKQPSTNPRMRKSADALADAGHDVHVLYAFNAIWADDADLPIFQDAKWTRERVGGHPIEQKVTYFFSRLVRKIDEWRGDEAGALHRSKNTYIRLGVKWKPDLVIGHNPGALGPLTELGSRLEIPILFDAEDFHRGETNPESIASNRIAQLEDKTLPHLKKITAASPLIAQSYATLYPHLDVQIVNNTFPSKYLQTAPIRNENTLSIAWFSQVVGLDRGLEEFLDSLEFLKDINLSIHIIGLCAPEIKRHIKSKAIEQCHSMQFSPPTAEKDLFSFLSGVDIGLALELPSPQNRDICRTNKVYTYPLAGCYTLFSRTSAQIDFQREYPDAGELINLSRPESVADVIRTLDANRDELLEKRKKAWLLAKEYLNWEMESKQLIEVVNSMLNQ